MLLAHASMTARRLGLAPPPRSARLLDVLELFAFVRPAAFCAPSAAGLAIAAGLACPEDVTKQAISLRVVTEMLLAALVEASVTARDLALAQAEAMGRAGWAWAAPIIRAIKSRPLGRPWRNDGLDVWSRLKEWEEQAPPGEVGSKPIDPAAAAARLAILLERSGTRRATSHASHLRL